MATTTIHPAGKTTTFPNGSSVTHRFGGGGGGGGDPHAWQAQPGQFADALSGVYQSGNQGMGMLGAGYGGVAQGYGAAAQGIANERSNFYGANAMAEGARQAALGNVGTQALAAYGGAANTALQSQAMQNTAYMKSLSDMQAANQAGVSGLGRAQVVGGSLGGGGYQATGAGGPIASGSAGAGGGGGNSALNSLLSADAAYRSQLQSGYQGMADMPRQTLADSLTGVQSLAGGSQEALGRGMDQFYATQNDPANRADFGGLLSGLGSTLAGLGDLGRGVQSNTQAGSSALANLFDDSWGDRGVFDSPLERYEKNMAVQDLRTADSRARQAEQAQQTLREIAYDRDNPRPRQPWYTTASRAHDARRRLALG